MVLARVKDRADLDDLTKTVFTLEGVARSYTHVVLNTVKEDGRTRPAPKPDAKGIEHQRGEFRAQLRRIHRQKVRVRGPCCGGIRQPLFRA